MVLMRDHEYWAAIVAATTRAVNQTDPVGLLPLGAPDDEYEPEVHDILAGLADAWPDPTAVLHLCTQVFASWLGRQAVNRRRMRRLAGRLIQNLRHLQRTLPPRSDPTST